ncbi:hypothetical protein Tco_0397494 [Tanacetum coccineum]
MCLYIDAKEHELGDLGEPANYKAALLNHESDKWLNAMNMEMQSMKENEVWDLVDLPPNIKIINRQFGSSKEDRHDGLNTTTSHDPAFYDYELCKWMSKLPSNSLEYPPEKKVVHGGKQR